MVPAQVMASTVAMLADARPQLFYFFDKLFSAELLNILVHLSHVELYTSIIWSVGVFARPVS